VRHITAERLDELEDLLLQLRRLDGLSEKKRGVFYRKSRAFLHFHEDPAGLFCDVRLSGADFDRFRVSTQPERRRLAGAVRRALTTG
jgi:hypothetical protein